MKRVTNDTWIMLGVLAAIVGAFVAGIYLPQSRQMDRWHDQVAKDKADLAADTEVASLVPSLMREVAELRTRYKDFNLRLPKEVDVGAFYRQMCDSFNREQLSTPNMKIQSPVREDLYCTLPIQLKTAGSYLAVGKLLQHLDAMDRLALVEKLELKALPGSESVDATLLVNIYHTEPEVARNDKAPR